MVTTKTAKKIGVKTIAATKATARKASNKTNVVEEV